MEIVEIGLNDLEVDTKKVNFGTGIELLMNDKQRSKSANINIDLGEIDKLESDLNELTGNSGTSDSSTKTLSGFASNIFNSFSTKTEPVVGAATVEQVGTTKTWDGYSKINEVPKETANSTLNDREKRRKKRAMLKKLEEWKDKGLFKNGSHFDMDSVFEEVEDEYETAMEDKRKKDSVKLQGWWFITFINSIEYANTAFNPFDLNLDGWGEQISEDLDSYEDIFSELHDKYKGGKLSPELSLLLRLGFSAAVINITNKALSTATPGFNDVIRQSPELMKMFTNATVESMNKNSPEFSFANNVLNPGPPPPAVDHRQPAARPGMQYTNRPDISMSRGAMFKEQGVELNGYEQSKPRPEMRGPVNTDINNILSGLKTKTVDIHDNDDSMISISSLKDLQNTSIPKKSNRRKTSERNTISLDI